MANQLGDPRVTPRSYVQHQRHARFGRLRHAKQFVAFLKTQAARLSGGPTEEQVFDKLTTNTATRVKQSAAYSDLA